IAIEAPAKKKRSRKKAAGTTGTTPPRTRKKKSSAAAHPIVEFEGPPEPPAAAPVVASEPVDDLPPNAASNWDVSLATAITTTKDAVAGNESPAEAASDPTVPFVPSEPDVIATDAAEPSIDVAIAAADATTPIEVIDATSGTWQPTMPPIETTPSVPWKRPTLGKSTYVMPSLIIDDSDPDLADREREERDAAAKAGAHRVSFLPPILLDREDRSARQGGLTLAVILLLIAATLTLSYLMRRPGAGGDGMTGRDAPLQRVERAERAGRG